MILRSNHQKLGYLDRHFDGLRVLPHADRVDMDSNSVEKLIRRFALNRKNVLFAGHDEGAAAWGRIASLIATAKMNGVEPLAYLKTVLEAIAAGYSASKIDQLLPWAFTPATPGNLGVALQPTGRGPSARRQAATP